MTAELLAAVDVGTGSARAGVLTPQGEFLGRAERPIDMRRRGADEAEHDSSQIWQAVCDAMRAALAASGGAPSDIRAIGFDATCSLVVRGKEGEPLPVAPDGDPRWDTIVWLDHRARAEADECTATADPALESFGGSMSPEMQLPKLMWLRRHLPGTWLEAGQVFDLVDFLSFRASGSSARSRSTLTAKWGFGAGGVDGWPTGFLDRIGLSDLLQQGGLPSAPVAPGADIGTLTAAAAAELGLTTGCHVAAGLIDAHAGALGVLGAAALEPRNLAQHLCLVAGTSNSILALSPERHAIAGVWGPYPGAILPGTWLLEAGQSASGALLDHLIRWHSAGGEPDAARHLAIADRIGQLQAGEGPDLAAGLNVLPDFHGNRSPLADPAPSGVISGLGLDASFDSLCRLYWRAAVALALGTRQNLERLRDNGFATDRLYLAGGHTRNPLLTRLYADATGATIVEPDTPDAVLLGAAMLAATAGGLYPSLPAAAAAMDRGGRAVTPNPATRGQFDRDYRILTTMQRHRRELAGLG